MGLDSVEIVMGWEESFGITIADAEATVLRTPRQSMDLIATKLAVCDDAPQACLTLRAFLRLRHAVTTAAYVSRDQVRPRARLRNLVKTDRRHTWERVRAASGISSLPDLGLFSPRTVGDLARWMVAYAAKNLKHPNKPWTRREIRTVVRAVVTEVVGKDDFEDDHDFVRDIGLD